MEDLKQTARGIFAQALADCSIPRAFDRVLRIEKNAQLIVDSEALVLDGEAPIALNRLRRVRIVAAGKAAAPMLEAMLARLPLPSACDLAVVLIAPARPQSLPSSIQLFAGGHPSPSQASFAGASAALTMLRAVAGPAAHSPADSDANDTLCLFLISGGASSMMELPLDASISLADTIAFHQTLVLSGATIVEINCVRKHFSAVKGGRLALAAGSARKLTLTVSDVPPAHLDALASGPTLADPTSVADCREILARYALLDESPARLPEPVRRFFASSNLPETPKPGEFVSPVHTLLDSGELAAAAEQQAATLGFHTVIDNTCDDWPYDRAADYLLGRLRALRRSHPRCCLISTGEISVPVPHFEKPAPHFDASASHLGGRNQHLALYLATQLRPDDSSIAILSSGSDGIDGNSAAAGAVIDEHTLDEASPASDRRSALRALTAFDSSTWLTGVDAAIITGPTGQNLRDLRILLADTAR